MQYNFDEIINRTGTNSVKYDLRQKIFNNPDVLPLWVADMDFKTPDFILEAVQRRLEHGILGYTYIPSSFYGAVVRWNQRQHNWKIQEDWISFSPGVVPALSLLIMTYTKPGDGIIIQPPVYFPFFSVIKSHQRRLITNPLQYRNGEYNMDLSDLEAKIDSGTRMLILSNPHNPTGNAWPPDVLERLAQICIKNKILLISDEIHSDLILPGNRHTPTAGLSDKIARNTITCMSPSKTFNLAGLSTAYLVIPDRKLRLQYEEVLDRVHVGAGNIFGFIAAEAAYNFGDEWLSQLLVYLNGNLRFLQEFMARYLPMIYVIPAQATYLIWLDCRNLGMPAEKLKKFMIQEAGLGLNDGLQFGVEGEGFQRINIGCPRQVLHQALVKLQAAINKYFKK